MDNDLRPKVYSDYYVEWLEKQLALLRVSSSTALEQLFNKCKLDDPTMTKEEFNEALELWLYRWEKDQQIKQMRSKQ